MNTSSKLRTMRIAAAVVAVSLSCAPSPAAARDSNSKEASSDFGIGVVTALANVVYMPVKVTYGVMGGITGGFAYVLSGANRDVAEGVWVPSLGGDYVQLDAPNYAQWHVDRDNRAAFEAWGHDMATELAADAEIDDSVFEGIAGVTRAIHICRGNAPGGRWLADGGYEAIAPAVFPRLTRYDRLLLEYDTPRAGDFGPLRHVRPDTVAVLGLLTTKRGALEDAAAVEARIREAAGHVALERLALSPQCGFASGEAGNPLTAEEQQAKLRRVATIARRIWPR